MVHVLSYVISAFKSMINESLSQTLSCTMIRVSMWPTTLLRGPNGLKQIPVLRVTLPCIYLLVKPRTLRTPSGSATDATRSKTP